MTASSAGHGSLPDGFHPDAEIGGRSDESSASPRYWRGLVLVEIANFPDLRRHLGVARCNALAADIAAGLRRANLNLEPGVAGRRTVELALQAEARDAVERDIGALCAFLARPFFVDGEAHEVRLAIGAGIAPAGLDDDVRLAEIAEAALAQGGNAVLDLSDPDFAFDKAALVRELPRALDAGELFVQYQPKLHVRQRAIVSAEALIRWQHPERGLVLPGDFIAAAESSGQIGELTLWTLRRVIADQRRLAQAGHDMPIFINISGILLADADFVARACEILRAADTEIGFEITETAVIRDPETALAHLREFADIGVRLAIDDYGAGLSSLAYLKQLPASELKIDKLFVTQLTSSNRDPLIVRSTIDLAHAMEMEVTAEGVETAAAMALLGVMGCDMVQGYLISRPIGFEAFVQYLDSDAHLAATAGERPTFGRLEGFSRSA